MTLTEASRMSGLLVITRAQNSSLTTARAIPYSERYSQRTGLMETPVENLQRAAEEEARRESKDDDQ